MNNCAKINENYTALLSDKNAFLSGLAGLQRVKTAEAKKNLLDLMKKIQTTEAELRKDGDPNLIALREKIAKRHGAKFVSGFQKNMAIAEFEDGKSILVNKNGDKIFDNVFATGLLLSINEGIAVVSVLGEDDCIRDDGTTFQIKQANAEKNAGFSEGLLLVKRTVGGFAKYGFIDTAGKMHPKNTANWYSLADSFSNGYAKVFNFQPSAIYFYIDKTGAVFNKGGNSEFINAERFSENIAAVQLPSGTRKWKYMNTDGQIISGQYEFQHAGFFKNGVAVVKLNDRFGYFTLDGKLIPTENWPFEMPEEFSDGYGLMKRPDGYRYIDKAGKFYPDPSQPAFTDANSFSEGLAFVKFADGRSGYVNKEFKLVIECDIGAKFKDGVAFIIKKIPVELGHYIDKSGNEVF